jgi:preprotein translocase subunit SecG
MLTLGLATWLVGILVVLFVAISALVMLTILIQKPQGGGLSGAFGSGAGSGQTAFGAKTGDALTIATIGMFTVWVLFAIGLNYAVRPSEEMPVPPAVGGAGEQGAENAGAEQTTPVQPATPATTPATAPAPETPGATPPAPAPTETPGAPPAGKPAEQPPQPAGNPGPTGGG